MTLIAAFGIETGPVFLTDGLLSSPDGQENIGLPSIGKVPPNVRILGGSRVHATTRKTEIVTPKLIVAWAGNYAAAHRILHEIRIFAREVTDEADWVERHVRANCRADLENVSLIVSGWRSERVLSWSNSCQEFKAPGMTIWAQGSGRHRFGGALQSIDFPSLTSLPPPNGAVSAAFAVAGCFLGEEMRQSTTLQAGFGGFYDITAFDASVARLIDNVVYLFWRVTRTPERLTVSPPFRAMKVLTLACGEPAIYTVDFVVSGNGMGRRENERYSLHSIDAGREASKRRNEDLGSVWQVNVLIIELEDGTCAIQTLVTCRPDGAAHPVRFVGNTLSADATELGSLIERFLRK